ncbi:hypothetical protein [Trueperella bialowiezensis]|uniref:hypothetical protein n=1 Tax=Trueperella bialowiezensis TaxID=312285 RepID=UPI0018D5204D|nr:hypothetical protein [Trueperella bialowiezensis]
MSALRGADYAAWSQVSQLQSAQLQFAQLSEQSGHSHTLWLQVVQVQSAHSQVAQMQSLHSTHSQVAHSS